MIDLKEVLNNSILKLTKCVDPQTYQPKIGFTLTEKISDEEKEFFMSKLHELLYVGSVSIDLTRLSKKEKK